MKNFNHADTFVNFLMQSDNPLDNTPLGQVVALFIGSNDRVGVRSFADKAGLTRQRLQQIMENDPPTFDEENRIRKVFARYAERMSAEKDK